MIKEELIEIIAAENGIHKARAKTIVSSVLAAIQTAVANGDKVTLAGFGTFEAVVSKPRLGRNPATGESVNIDAKRKPKFVAGRAFRDVCAVKVGPST